MEPVCAKRWSLTQEILHGDENPAEEMREMDVYGMSWKQDMTFFNTDFIVVF